INNHQYSQTVNYGFNTQFINANSISLTSPLTKKLSLSLGAGYTNAINYAGTQKGYVSTSESLSYSLNKKTSLSLGVATEKSAFEYDGSYSNFDLFDSRTSVVFGNLTIIN
ncbi:hypothetical protein N9W41_00935, partial [bacterium]|nr:hypothetical protein [bacterium]